ncbi:MAG TPA: putative zinc-binding protein [Syntrophorhabdaceae bacterium]|jgi:uncharacterized metal-binding protein
MVEEKDTCSGATVKTLILGCSGGSNVGQIANNVMIEMDKKGMGNAYCLAGAGADLSGFVESARAGRTILIDGCPVGCGKKIFGRQGITPTRYYVITELGIEKRHDFHDLAEETGQAVEQIVGNG